MTSPVSVAQPDRPKHPGRRKVNWGLVCTVICAGVLFYFLGTVTWQAYRARKEVKAHAWDAEERRKSIEGSSFLFLLWYLLIALFHGLITQGWLFFFAHISLWLHLPLLARVDQAALWPPTPSTVLYRWALSFPLKYLLTWVLLSVDDLVRKGAQEPVRVALPEEVVLPPRARGPNANQRHAASPASPATQRRPNRSGFFPGAPVSSPEDRIPKAVLLWGRINWSEVPEGDPLKQAILQEAGEPLLQRDSQGVRVQGRQVEPTPAPPLPHSSEDDDYDWGQGEGSLPL
jgi:hypothetical protein